MSDNRPLLRLTLSAAALLAAAALLPAAATAQAEAAPRAAAPARAASGDPQGFLYGRVETRSGSTYQGRLRWDDEEAFWGDHFNSTKEDRPYADRAPREMRQRREPIEIFGITVGVHWEDDGGRQFIARFGDLQQIDVGRGDDLTVTMKSGKRHELEGGSNDVGADVIVWDESVGRIALEWDNIDRIRFLPTPKDLAVDVFRLHGTVETDAGTFRGWIQWDQEECLSTDELDGNTGDGDLSIRMGRIRRIERASSRSSRVTLDDGRELRLDGTNDVDDDNRGIWVEDESIGRVLVSWDAFESVDFDGPVGSGPSYASFAPGKDLAGTVTLRSGRKLTGKIVYDLDESETWELLGGDYRDVEYNVPLSMIAAVVPESYDSSRLVLRNGKELVLENSADVGDGNAGIAVVRGADVEYVEWEEVRRIDFD